MSPLPLIAVPTALAALLLAPLLCSCEEVVSRDAAFIGYSEKEGAAGGAKRFIIKTTYGEIKILPRHDISPGIVKAVEKVAKQATCHACKFYRHEPVPANWGKENYWGPPYALLQGSLAEMGGNPPFEGNPPVQRGDVCMIPGCQEFFIATAAHTEWGTAHSVWGKVEDEESWRTIAAIPEEPFFTRTDGGGIITRWLYDNGTIPFEIRME